MRFNASYLETLGEVRVELDSNSYSDAWPMLRRIAFRKLPIDLTAQCLPLAVAILTRSYCGDIFEFGGIKIAADYADAIRTVIGPQANVVNVDGMNRGFSTGEIDVVAGRASKSVSAFQFDGTTHLARVDWSGDFVDTASRSSANFAFGAVQTNAAFFADSFSVSVAIGLLFGRDRCNTLHVTDLPPEGADIDLIREALRIVGVTLETPASSLRLSA